MPLKLTLEFSDDDLNDILKAAAFGDDEPYTIDTLKKAGRYREFVNELKDTAPNFVFEIVDGSREACANDWLQGFCISADEEDEDDYIV